MIDERRVASSSRYAERTGLIERLRDHVWAVNSLLEALKLDSYTEPGHSSGRTIDLARRAGRAAGRRPRPRRAGRTTPWSTATCSTPR